MKRYLFLLPLLVLGLASCNNKPNSGNEPGQIEPEKPNPGDKDPDKDPDKPVEPEVPDNPDTYIWSEESDTLMKEHLGGYVLPKFDEKDYEWTYDATYDCVSLFAKGTKSMVDKIALEYSKVDTLTPIYAPTLIDQDIYAAEFRYLFPTEELNAYVEIMIYTDNTNLGIDLYYIPVHTTWDTTFINETLSLIGVEGLTLPEPSFEFSWIESDASYLDSGLVTIYVTVAKDYSEQYKTELKAAGFKDYVSPDFSDDFVFLADANEKAFLDIYYLEDYNQIALDIYSI